MRAIRQSKGNALFLTISIGALILIPAIAVFIAVALFMTYSQRAESIVEAAAKVGAIDLSHVVANDPYFGWVSLSNQPAEGIVTRSADGQALPVVGMDTLVGTLHQNAEIGTKLQNSTISSLAQNDLEQIPSAVSLLNKAIERTPVDSNGKKVDVAADVEDFLRAGLPAGVRLENTNITLGWVENDTKYGDAPGLDRYAHLVAPEKFREPDGKHAICAIRIDCTFSTTDGKNLPIETSACAQAYCDKDRAAAGKLTLRFPGPTVAGLTTWNELLSRQSFSDHGVRRFDVVRGDYPVDREARLHQIADASGAADEFAYHLYMWLRNGRLRPRAEAVVAMLNEPFSPYSSQTYTYEFGEDGSIKRTQTDSRENKPQIASDGQMVAMADMKTRSGANAIAIIHDNVDRLSTDSGKHAGRPLDGLAVDIEIGGTHQYNPMDDVIAMKRRTASRRI